jgi:glycosyltransferase involved in cell wall biosynthesis
MISCLCVTRGNRPTMLASAVGDFVRQSFPDKELLILHDGGATVARDISGIIAQHRTAPIRIERAPPGRTLGALRNLAVDHAAGEWICQWDDDDRYHPERLALQWAQATADAAPVNYLVDQLHWFTDEGLLCWDDWDSEPYPLNLVQGTMLARRDILPAYPDLARGEDTRQTHLLLRAAHAQGFPVSRLHGAGWCYIYVCHGANVWDRAHHRAISRAKHLGQAILLPRLATLRARLGEYEPGFVGLRIKLGQELLPL